MAAASLVFAVCCTKNFQQINTDPDNPLIEDVKSTNILAFCERYASQNMWDEWFELNETCGFSGQISKMQYTQEGYYAFRPSVNSSSWEVCYKVASNLQAILNKEEEGSNMWAAATVFQCNIFQVICDRWGACPYSEAFKLDSGVTKPAYDTQESIYLSLLDRLAVASESFDPDGDDLGEGDVMLWGDIELWTKYANALQLKIAARIANVAPDKAKAVFEHIMGDKLPILEDNNDNIFFTTWGAEYSEPWAVYYQQRQQEYAVSELVVNILESSADPRLSVYAEPTPDWVNGVEGASMYKGYPVGLKANAVVSRYSKIGEHFQHKSSLSGFTPWLRSCEQWFAIAYAASKGWDVGKSEEEAYAHALTLSMEEYDIDQDVIEAYLAADNYTAGDMEKLFTQWWISLFKNGQEAWSVYRMSGYPGGNVIAPDSFYPGHNVPPMAYGYPDSERNLNAESCAVFASAEVDYFWGKQMWWDVRQGLK